ncbi:MAG: hypothetical protein DCF16_18015 [Alphaproteobacteria bacterium]|nr:MAG: hypothetical protein DCF16_18015 [Alphaproteobacteria bacterium]
MRALWAAAICGLIFCAPATAQDGGQVAQIPAESEEITDPVTAENASVAEDGQVADANAETSDAKDKAEINSIPTIGPVAGYTYFHRQGATLADQRADLAMCRPTILAMTHENPSVVQSGGYPTTVYVPQNGPAMSAGAAAGAGVAAIIVVAAVAAAQQRAGELRGMQLNYENCMLTRGWSVMVLDQETGNTLDRLSESRLEERLESMVGAAAPLGALGRAFDNAHQFGAHADVDEMSLSLRFLPDNYFAREVRRGNNMLHAASRREERERAERARERDAREAERERALEAAYEGRTEGAASVDIGALAELPEGSALILVESVGPTPRFVRMNAQEGDGADLIASRHSNTLSAFVVPAGDWRLVSLWTGAPATSHCLGAPVFRANAGDVVFAGAFGADGAADLTLENVRAQLAEHPALAERLQAASYTNGSTFECGLASFATAYEIEGAPFAEGYAWGSRAAASQ